MAISWLVIYLMMCVSYVSILNPFQWIVDFESYGEVWRNLIVFCCFPLWVFVSYAISNINELGVSSKIERVIHYLTNCSDFKLDNKGE